MRRGPSAWLCPWPREAAQSTRSSRRPVQVPGELAWEIQASANDSGAEQPPDDVLQRIVEKETTAYNARLIASACIRQCESAVLPARQLGQEVPLSPFSEKQQRQSRYDGATEADGHTKRDFIEATDPPEEALAHIARAQQQAMHDHEAPSYAYRAVKLTGCQLCSAPHYLLPNSFGNRYPLGDKGEVPEGAFADLPDLPWEFDPATGEL